MARSSTFTRRMWQQERRIYGLNNRQVMLMSIFPLGVILLISTLLVIPATRASCLELLTENKPVELATFAALFAAFLLGVVLFRRSRLAGESSLNATFFAFFSLGALVVALEEVAWGQWFFGFATPEALRDINMQGEMTLHNIAGMHGNTEILRMGFGIAGLLGIAAHRFTVFRGIAPCRLLFPWFFVIAVFGGFDLLVDHVPIHRYFDYWVDNLAEVVEMLVGFSSVLYLWLALRRRDTPLAVYAPAKRRRQTPTGSWIYETR